MKRLSRMTVGMFASLAWVSCSSVLPTRGTVTQLEVGPQPAIVGQGATVQLHAQAHYADGSAADATGDVLWSSGTASVAVADQGGKVLGLAPGVAIVSATLGGITSNAAVTVTGATDTVTAVQASVVSLAVTPPVVTVAPGTSSPLAAQANLSDHDHLDVTRKATWASDLPAVATVDPNGVVHGVAAGGARITASYQTGVSNTVSVTVTHGALVSVALTPPVAALAPDATLQLHAQANFSDNSKVDLTGNVTWSSSDPTVASVDATGKVTAFAAGTASIGATWAGTVSNPVALTVTHGALTSLAVTPDVGTLAPKSTLSLTVAATYSDGTMVDVTDAATWASDKRAVATVNGGGIAKAVAAGTAHVTATFEGLKSNSVTLTVTHGSLVALRITPLKVSLPPAALQQLTAQATYNDGSAVDVTATASWVSSALGVATVNASGTVQAVAVGQATVTASFGGLTTSVGATPADTDPATITVTHGALTAVTVSPATSIVMRGAAQPLTAQASYADASKADVTSASTWISDAPLVATVDATGKVQAFATGVAHLTAAFGGITSGAVLVTVP